MNRSSSPSPSKSTQLHPAYPAETGAASTAIGLPVAAVILVKVCAPAAVENIVRAASASVSRDRGDVSGDMNPPRMVDRARGVPERRRRWQPPHTATSPKGRVATGKG